MMILSVHNLTKYFGERALFSGLSFDVGERDKIGLVGDNGCGKTTLFKLLTRELPADGGEAVRSKEARIGYMEQHACADPSRTLWDEVESVFAPVAAMEVMNAKLEKHLRGSVNRRVNCDAANLDKAVEAAQEQLSAIRILRERGLLEHLPGKLRLAAKAREENPEASLSELAAMMEPPITKPAMNHRMKKIVCLATEEPK